MVFFRSVGRRAQVPRTKQFDASPLFFGHALQTRNSLVAAQRLCASVIRDGASSPRLHKILSRLVKAKKNEGANFKVAAIGGSITAGASASRVGVNDWFAQVVHYMHHSFPNANIEGRNLAFSATPSMLMDLCLEKHIDADVHLVFVEYCANDGRRTGNVAHDDMITRGYERLLHRLLNLPGSPAVVLVQSMSKGMMYVHG